jgi:hypothetical protein
MHGPLALSAVQPTERRCTVSCSCLLVLAHCALVSFAAATVQCVHTHTHSGISSDDAARTRSAWPVAHTERASSLWELYICLRRNKAKALFKRRVIISEHQLIASSLLQTERRNKAKEYIMILWSWAHGFHARPACVYPNYTRKLFWKQKYRKNFLSTTLDVQSSKSIPWSIQHMQFFRACFPKMAKGLLFPIIILSQLNCIPIVL